MFKLSNRAYADAGCLVPGEPTPVWPGLTAATKAPPATACAATAVVTTVLPIPLPFGRGENAHGNDRFRSARCPGTRGLWHPIGPAYPRQGLLDRICRKSS